MWILVVEALGALGLLLFIVWWTLGPAERRERAALRERIEREAAAHALSDAPNASSPRDPSSSS